MPWLRAGDTREGVSVHSRLRTVCQCLTNAFKTLVSWSVSTFMCYPFWEDAEVESVTSKMETLFHLKFSGVEDESLGLMDNPGTNSNPNHRKCVGSLTAVFSSTYLWVRLFPHEDHQVQKPFHQNRWSFGSVLEAGHQQLLSGPHVPGWFHSVQVIKAMIKRSTELHWAKCCHGLQPPAHLALGRGLQHLAYLSIKHYTTLLTSCFLKATFKATDS